MRLDNGKRRMIMSVAMDLFSRNSYHRVVMDEIAREAKVAKGTLYYHFKSKEALYASLLHDGLDQMIQRLKERFTEGNPIDNLNLFIKEMVSFFNENRSFFIVLQREEGKLFSKKLDNCYNKICTINDLLGSLLEDGVDKGVLRDDIDGTVLVEMIMGMIKSPVLKGKITSERQSDSIIKVLTEGITIQGG
ncbi:MAG TPA: TetR/AcrR family transcriptional regulator [Nitrospirae bacterium]|nr:TetR/AcrR family transcriptional regulator [Nitrospirota bacterium]HDO36477.1 TetR/AcrR family transcriptional regulator [Nitrospirota bacterium]HDY70459.1 TetR/AcrR family transcriptional regulator [Nitrospirota bacterium]